MRGKITFQEYKHNPRVEDIKNVKKNKYDTTEELLDPTPHNKLTGINLYLYTDFNNRGFLVENSDSESNRRLHAVCGNTLDS